MNRCMDQTRFNQKQARENIEKYLSQMNIAHPELHLLKKNGAPNKDRIAEHFGFPDSRTISKFFRDDPQRFNFWTFKEIAKRTGIHEAYWQGLTVEQDQSVYEAKLREDRLSREAMDELERLQDQRHRNEVERNTVFFDLLGYRYDCDVNWQFIDRPHTITKKGTSDSQVLSDLDLKRVIDEAAGFLDYALYKIRKE